MIWMIWSRIARLIPFSRNAACTPNAASIPKAEQPKSAIALDLHRVVLLEQVGLTRSRRAAQRLHGGDRKCIAQYHCNTRLYLFISDIADPQSGDVGDQVQWPGF